MEMHFHEKPKLGKTCMVAGWPGMGMLAKVSVDYLIQQLETRLFAETYTPRNNIYFKKSVGELEVDKHRFYYWKGEQQDLLLCSGENQPKSVETIYRLANRVVDVAEEFNVSRIYTFAAVPHHYKEEPKVVAVVNKPELKGFFEEHGVAAAKGEGRITGLNGLLIGIARERGIEGICLMCEIRYLNIPQFRSSKTVLETLTGLLGIKLEMSDLERQAKEVDEKVQRIKKRRKSVAGKQKEPQYIG